jgi:hypothetical protein
MQKVDATTITRPSRSGSNDKVAVVTTTTTTNSAALLHSVLQQDFDQMLSKEIQSLSIHDRIKVQEEIHGVSNLCPTETPTMVEAALTDMEHQLDNIANKPIYDQLSPFSYLHSRLWMLRFLRCELFDAKRAAQRLIRFTEYMYQEYDTIEVLERPLRLSDLPTNSGRTNNGKEVMDSFKTGHSQLLPFRDRSGRRIFVTCKNHSLIYEANIRVGTVGFF